MYHDFAAFAVCPPARLMHATPSHGGIYAPYVSRHISNAAYPVVLQVDPTKKMDRFACVVARDGQIFAAAVLRTWYYMCDDDLMILAYVCMLYSVLVRISTKIREKLQSSCALSFFSSYVWYTSEYSVFK